MHSTLKMLKHLLISCPVDKMQIETDVPRTNFKRLGLTQSFFNAFERRDLFTKAAFI